MFDACYNYARRQKWDKNAAASKILETVDDTLDVVYQVSCAVFVAVWLTQHVFAFYKMVEGRLSVSSRDFVNARLKHTADNGFVVVW